MRIRPEANNLLPIEQPFQKALAIYRNRLIIVLAILLGNFGILGTFTNQIAFTAIKYLVLIILIAIASFVIFSSLNLAWIYFRYGYLPQGIGEGTISFIFTILQGIAYVVGVIAIILLAILLVYGVALFLNHIL